MRERFLEIEQSANQSFLDRQDAIHGLSLAALSGQHVFFIGAPGTAKSALIRWYCDRFPGTDYFQWLLTRFSTPEELFGPVDLAGLKAGTFRRIIAGKAPEAHIAFLDEIFKANSAILNALLSWLQERIFHNDGLPMQCPLIFAAAASNELPEEDEALGALYDRFMLRYQVGYIKDRSTFLSLLQSGGATVQAPVVTQQELAMAREDVSRILVPPESREAMADLRDHLRNEGIIVSDRRFVQSLSVLRAEAYLRGLDRITPECLEAGANIYWDRPDDARKVRGLCLRIANPNFFRAQEIFEAAEEAAGQILAQAASDNAGTGLQQEAIQVSAELRRMAEKLDDLSGNKGESKIGQMARQVRELNRQVISKGVGIDVSA